MSVAAWRSVVGVALLGLLLACKSFNAPPDDGKRWGEPQVIDTLPADALRPALAVDAMGHAIAVWDQTDRSTATRNESDDIWSRERGVEGPWGTQVLLEDNEPLDSIGAQVSAGEDGSVVVVFLQEQQRTEGTSFYIWAVRREPSGVWQPAECIQANGPNDCAEGSVPGDAARPHVAVGPRGDAVAVWQQSDEDGDERLRIWANRFTSERGWGGAVVVEDDNNISVAPRVAVDIDGNAIAIWERFDGVRSSIFSKRQERNADWKDFGNVESDDSGNAFSPQIAVGAEGNAIAVWQQETEGAQGFDIWANRYAPAIGWGQAERIDLEGIGDAANPQIATDGMGNAIAVWVHSGEAIWSNRYTAGFGWGDAEPIGPTGLGSARAPKIASSSAGDAVAVWVQFDGIRDVIWANRYKEGVGWGDSDAISSGPGRALGPEVAMGADGNAVAVWTQDDADGDNTWSNSLE